MKRLTRNLLLSLAGAGCLAASVQVTAHLNDKEPMQSYRQSYFTLVAMNFGPIGSMVKGEMPWDDARLKLFANDLATLGSMDVSRAFGPGTDKGTTRAKPEIWSNQEDFRAKLEDMQGAVAALQVAAESGDRKAIAEATGVAGKSCKSCHDEYKSKDYLY
ncbi:c-type cytochrome [Pseudohalioglobus lutimaris]|uniref:Cytochrome C n=1 Tax=Pseudohalioglobus lutimaris TaxID=1737061 RepID=A0A2N5WYH6_9GAMM|nr:cytochrome c [Pseudohalioglobus lutimaris]PLW67295.1 cytochrome C [Pseudohalioglobus lutimaris]